MGPFAFSTMRPGVSVARLNDPIRLPSGRRVTRRDRASLHDQPTNWPVWPPFEPGFRLPLQLRSGSLRIRRWETHRRANLRRMRIAAQLSSWPQTLLSGLEINLPWSSGPAPAARTICFSAIVRQWGCAADVVRFASRSATVNLPD
jgi:hypothetical protein